VVIGAGSGLGRALCQELAQRGGRIVASDIDLADDGVGVRVLCPTFFQTNIVNAACVDGDPSLLDPARQSMAAAKLQAIAVARFALYGMARGDVYIVPHADGRWLWRLKRLHPAGFNRLGTKLLAWRAGRSGAA